MTRPFQHRPEHQQLCIISWTGCFHYLTALRLIKDEKLRHERKLASCESRMILPHLHRPSSTQSRSRHRARCVTTRGGGGWPPCVPAPRALRARCNRPLATGRSSARPGQPCGRSHDAEVCMMPRFCCLYHLQRGGPASQQCRQLNVQMHSTCKSWRELGELVSPHSPEMQATSKQHGVQHAEHVHSCKARHACQPTANAVR